MEELLANLPATPQELAAKHSLTLREVHRILMAAWEDGLAFPSQVLDHIYTPLHSTIWTRQ